MGASAPFLAISCGKLKLDMADPPIITEFAVNVTMMPQSGPPTTGQWGKGQLIFDASGEMYICVQASDIQAQQPAVWKHLSGGGGGAANIAVEDLTSQVDGQTDTFSTSQARVIGTIQAFLNGQDLGTPGTLAGGAHIEETSDTVFKIDYVPSVGEEVHVRYFVPPP